MSTKPATRRGGPQPRRRRTDIHGNEIDPPGIWEYDTPAGLLGFEVNYTGADGKTKWKRLGAISLRAAKQQLEALRTDARRSREGGATTLMPHRAQPRPHGFREPAPTVLELHTRWRERLKGTRGTLGKYDAYIRYRIGDLAEKRVDEITRDEIETWLEDLQSATTCGKGQHPRPLADGTIITYANLMLSVLRRASAWWPTVEEDTAPLQQLGEPDARRMALSDDELARLLDSAAALSTTVQALIVLGAFTGMRIAEVAGLRWSEVDFVAGVIHVYQQLRVVDGEPIKADLKSKHSRRHVLMPDGVAERLGALPGQRTADAFVFCHEDGSPMRPEYLRGSLFYPAVDASGVQEPFSARAKEWRQKPERLVFHHLRHTYASMMIARGTDVALLARQLGHRDADITQKVYKHFYDQHHHGPAMRQALDTELTRLLRAA